MTTLKDIAAAAGVSVDTVSRVLNGKAGEAWPSAVKRAERIRELAAQLNYAPNKAAQIMRTKRTNQIGVLVSELYNPSTGRKVEAIGDELSKYGYEMLLGLTRGGANNPLAFFQKFSRNLLDGVINLDPNLDTADLRRVARNTPCLTFNRTEADSPAVFDIRKGVHLALEHLWSLGHRRIAIVTGADKGDAASERIAAYENFYAGHPVAASPGWIIRAGWKAEDGRHAAPAFIATGCTACVAGNDLLAVGLLSGLRAGEIEVPRDVSLVSIDDTLLTEISYPTLTAIHQPVDEMVALTVKALVSLIAGEAPDAHQILPPTLVVRESCGAPREES